MMPRWQRGGWAAGEGHLSAICAKTPKGEACCEWVGQDGAGHFVKMTTTASEYGDMQLICEAYQLMKEGLGADQREMHDVFTNGTRGNWTGYLIEINARHSGPQGSGDRRQVLR